MDKGGQGFDQVRLLDFCKHIKENFIDITEHRCRLKALHMFHSARLHEGDLTVSLGDGLVERLGTFLKSPDSAVTPNKVYGFVLVLREVQDCVFTRSPFHNGPANRFVEDSYVPRKDRQNRNSCRC